MTKPDPTAPMPSLKVAVIVHSGYGHTRRLADHLLRGVQQVEAIQAERLTAQEATEQVQDLQRFDGMLFGAPTYMGSLAAVFKTFMEASSPLWAEQAWNGKLAGGFTNSLSLAGDKGSSLMQLVVFAAQHGMHWVTPGLLNASAANDQTSGDPRLVNRMGFSVGLAAQSENDAPDVTPPSGDLLTAEHYGERFAQAVARWHHAP